MPLTVRANYSEIKDLDLSQTREEVERIALRCLGSKLHKNIIKLYDKPK
jgi:hypothetical protein